MCCFNAHLQQFLSGGPLLWVLGQGQFDKMVKVVCPAVQQREKDKEKKKKGFDLLALLVISTAGCCFYMKCISGRETEKKSK